MKRYSAPADRHNYNHMTLQSGDFSYELQPCWAQLPKELGAAEITGVACDSEGYVYVLTRHPDMPIMVFDDDGKYLRAMAQGVFPARPHGIFINEKDALYVTDDNAHIAVKLTKTGEVLAVFGEAGKPSDTGCDRQAYLKWRAQNNIPGKVRHDNYFILEKQIDTIARTAGPFNGPTRMIEAPDGQLFCCDGYGNAAIHRFAADGRYLTTWGEPGREPGQFRLPHGILLDRQERLWVADRENNRLQIFDKAGRVLTIVEGLYRPTELCTDGTYIYLSESDAGFSILTQEAEIVAQFGFALSPFCFHGLGINPKGDLYAATLGKNRFNNIVKLKRLKTE